MPKLKSALASHQAQQARFQARAKAGKVKEDKEKSMRGKSKKAKTKSNQTERMVKGLSNAQTGRHAMSTAEYDAGSLVDTGDQAKAASRSRGRHLEDGHRGESSTAGRISRLTVDSKGKGRAVPQKSTNPIDRDDTVLLLGEANFSFAVALISPPHSHPPRLVCATSYDSEQTCYTKYPDARSNVSRLREAGVTIGFQIDAGTLERSKSIVGKGKKWSRVVFNFPHVGAGIKDQERNILSNQHLLLRTFRSAALLLTEGPTRLQDNKVGSGKKRKRKHHNEEEDDGLEDDDLNDDALNDFDFDDIDENGHDDLLGEDPDWSGQISKQVDTTFTSPTKQGTIIITLLNQSPYTLWSLPRLGTRPPPLCPGTNLPQPRYELLRSFTFDPALWPGYAHRRTLGFKEGVSKDGNEEIVGRKGEARTWEFALKPVEED